jgi:UDP-N-acetylglucosamine 4,6-dehydratase/UDP-glucose 4-epimerase
MSDALDFILHATDIGKGSEIFIPKLRSYSITDVKNVLIEILRNTGEEEIGIRPGEKLHEVLINTDEMKYVWEIDNMYMIINPLYQKFFNNDVKTRYPNAKKIESMKIYSSENVEKISAADLKQIIHDSDLL